MNYVYGHTINNTRGVSDFGMGVKVTPQGRPKYGCTLLPVPYACQDCEYMTKVNVMGNECDFIIMGKNTIGFFRKPNHVFAGDIEFVLFTHTQVENVDHIVVSVTTYI